MNIEQYKKFLHHIVNSFFVICFVQVYLVTGGEGSDYIYLATTELLSQGSSSWVYGGELPSARFRPRAATLDNKLILTGVVLLQCCTMIPYNIYRFILTGGFTKTGGILGISDNAFEWDTTTSTWKEMPSLKISKAWHAMSVLENANDIISSYCK